MTSSLNEITSFHTEKKVISFTSGHPGGHIPACGCGSGWTPAAQHPTPHDGKQILNERKEMMCYSLCRSIFKQSKCYWEAARWLCTFWPPPSRKAYELTLHDALDRKMSRVVNSYFFLSKQKNKRIKRITPLLRYLT